MNISCKIFMKDLVPVIIMRARETISTVFFPITEEDGGKSLKVC